MAAFDEVLGAAQELPGPDRIRLIGTLWDTVSPQEWPAPSEEWIAESQRRSAEVDAGRMPVSLWPEVRERARKEAGLDE